MFFLGTESVQVHEPADPMMGFPSIPKYGHGPWISSIIFIRLNDSHKSSMTAMRIIDDDVETLLTLDMSMEEDTRRRSLIQQRTDRLLYNEAPCVSQAELHQYSGKQTII